MCFSLSDILERVRAWRERRSALHEIAVRRAIEHDGRQISVASDIAAANLAVARGDNEAALRICAHVRQVQPDTPSAYLLPVRILHKLQHFEEANALIETARRRFPAEGDIARFWAISAQQSGDLAGAILRWQQVRKEFPGYIRAITGGARCLVLAGRLDEADTLISEAVQRFPKEDELTIESATLAVRRRDWPEALLRWQRVADRSPGSMQALLGITRSLCELQRHDEAEALLKARRMDFGVQPQPSIEYARLAERRRDWPEAAQRWAWVHEMFPQNFVAYVGLARAWLAQQRFDEAQALLEEAMAKFPEDAQVSVQYAEVAHRRRDWPEAVRRWEIVRQQLPEQPVGYRQGVAALIASGRKPEAVILESEMNRRFAAKPK